MGIENIELLIEQSVSESHDDIDMPAVLEKTTQDGPGFVGELKRLEESLPLSDVEENDQ